MWSILLYQRLMWFCRMTHLFANLPSFHPQPHSASMRRSWGIYWSDTSAGRQRADVILHIGSGCSCGAFSTLANETATKLQLGVKMGSVPFSFRQGISVHSHLSVSHGHKCKHWLSLSLYCFLMALSPAESFRKNLDPAPFQKRHISDLKSLWH